jgi:hypothetical protein
VAQKAVTAAVDLIDGSSSDERPVASQPISNTLINDNSSVNSPATNRLVAPASENNQRRGSVTAQIYLSNSNNGLSKEEQKIVKRNEGLNPALFDSYHENEIDRKRAQLAHFRGRFRNMSERLNKKAKKAKYYSRIYKGVHYSLIVFLVIMGLAITIRRFILENSITVTSDNEVTGDLVETDDSTDYSTMVMGSLISAIEILREIFDPKQAGITYRNARTQYKVINTRLNTSINQFTNDDIGEMASYYNFLSRQMIQLDSSLFRRTSGQSDIEFNRHEAEFESVSG